MGNILSSPSASQVLTPNKDPVSESEPMESESDLNETINNDSPEEQFHDAVSDEEETRAKMKEEEMIAFHKQLNIKREQRREIMAKHKSDKKMLENALEEERKSKLELYEQNRHLRDTLLLNNIEIPEILRENADISMFKETLDQLTQEIEKQKSNNNKLRCDLASSNSALHAAYSDIADLSAQHTESMKQINALKEVVTVSKTLISLREDQLTELKNKLTEIEQSLADREASMLSTNLRQEYERQLQNIRTLRGLYEERARLAEVTRQALVRELDEQKALYQTENSRCTHLTSEIDELKAKVSKLEEEIEEKTNEISSSKEEMDGTKSEMLVINKLFSEVLLGYKTKRDLDKLVQRLEENHGILTDMAEKENGSEASALPRLLLELVSQVDDSNTETNEIRNETTNDQSDNETEESNKAEEIVQNLPKVWKVLIELLSHQTESNTKESEKVTTCYKSVETKSGPVLVPSVSQTYIRLKDLIMEKLSLIKEVNHMKQLNSHLETRLQEQERRLCLVTTELSKTWHVVGRLRRHHHQLHTHEKILKYELQQKRKLLNELKEELEYCREKWEQAREKNSQSEKDWKKLRAEFSSRKLKDSSAFNNSAESGYSDERPSDESSESNDESEFIPESKNKCKNKFKKSFEIALDSSADFNLTAEREDPVSDMIDVADLSLDTQDENNETFDDSCNSENLLKSDRICDETEDEAADIGNDSCHEDICIAESSPDTLKICDAKVKIKTVDLKSSQISPKETILSEFGHSSQCQVTIDSNERLSDDKVQIEFDTKLPCDNLEMERDLSALPTSSDFLNVHEITEDCKPDEVNDQQVDRSSEEENSTLFEINETIVEQSVNQENKFKLILENVKKQDERLKLKDKKLNELENKCSEVLTNLTNTLNTGQIINKKLDALNEKHCVNNIQEASLNCNAEIEESEPGPSVSHKESSPITCMTVDLKSILENIKTQDENLKKKDERLTNLENNCSDVVANMKNVVNRGDELLQKINAVHDHCADTTIDEIDSSTEQNKSNPQAEASTSSEIDHEARFAARDLRLKRLEEQTKSLVNKVNSTTTKGVKIHYKLEELHNIYGSDHSRSGTPCDDTVDNSQSNDDDDEN